MFKYLKRVVSYAIAGMVLMAPGAYAKDPIRTIEGIVSKISDGDTVHVTDSQGTKVKVRLYGIDAPETEKLNKKTGHVSKPGQPYGDEAYQALYRKVHRKSVKLDVMAVDQYKRSVGIVYLNSRNVNQEMVAEGWAWAYRQYLDRPHASDYIQAEEQARANRLGLWKQNNPQPPWEFRKLRKTMKRQYK
jgi:micrococcal nuclease